MTHLVVVPFLPHPVMVPPLPHPVVVPPLRCPVMDPPPAAPQRRLHRARNLPTVPNRTHAGRAVRSTHLQDDGCCVVTPLLLPWCADGASRLREAREVSLVITAKATVGVEAALPDSDSFPPRLLHNSWDPGTASTNVT